MNKQRFGALLTHKIVPWVSLIIAPFYRLLWKVSPAADESSEEKEAQVIISQEARV